MREVIKSSNKYIVYDINSDDTQLDRVSIRMISNNHDKNMGIAHINVSESKNYKSLMYDVTGMISLNQYLSHHITQEDFREMIMNLVDTIEKIEEYMIDVTQIILDTNYVYINMFDKKVMFLCLPILGYKNGISLHRFFSNVANLSLVEVGTGISYTDCVRKALWTESGFSIGNLRAAVNSVEFDPQTGNGAGVVTVDTEKHVNDMMNNDAQYYRQPELNEVSSYNTGKNASQYNQTEQKKEPNEADSQNAKKNGGLLKRISGLFLGGKKESESSGFQGGISGYTKDGQRSSSIKNQQQNTPETNDNNSGKTNMGYSQYSAPISGQQRTQPNLQDQTWQERQSNSYKVSRMSNQRDESWNNQGVSSHILSGGTVPLDIGMLSDSSFMDNPNLPDAQQNNAVNSAKYYNDDKSGDQLFTDETTTLNGPESNGTTVLNYNPSNSFLYLVRVRNNERIPINKDVFHIGKERSFSDYFVADNTNVSRKHAHIVRRGTNYYIMDDNSKNHTFINGRMIPSGMEIPITNGTKIRLADEEFIVYLN